MRLHLQYSALDRLQKGFHEILYHSSVLDELFHIQLPCKFHFGFKSDNFLTVLNEESFFYPVASAKGNNVVNQITKFDEENRLVVLLDRSSIIKGFLSFFVKFIQVSFVMYTLSFVYFMHSFLISAFFFFCNVEVFH